MNECSGCAHPQDWHSQMDGECSHCSCTWSEPMVSYYMIDETETDIVCMDCGLEFKLGDPYKQRLDAMFEDIPVMEIICVYC